MPLEGVAAVPPNPLFVYASQGVVEQAHTSKRGLKADLQHTKR